jgi:hypothetical protein
MIAQSVNTMIPQRTIITALLSVVASLELHAQGGTWTWISGSPSPGAAALYGQPGVPGPTITPPALFDAQTWTDQEGRFWSFSGREANGYWHSDMWMYDPVIGQWAFIDGPMQPGTYFGNIGSIGVPSPANQPPGVRSAATWMDNNGDLWMFGGEATIGTTNMLWRYEPDVNVWTWMNGTTDLFDTGVWGTQGVAAPGNRPSPRALVKATWIDDNGDLWLFGGESGNYWADLWKYSVTTNMWTWMSGSSEPFAPGLYGAQGVGSPERYPSFRAGCGSWRSPDGAFWLFGGIHGISVSLNDLWRYDPLVNEWSWWAGDSIGDPLGDIPLYCTGSNTSAPRGRFGHRTNWIGADGTLWTFGGTTENNFGAAYNDLWKYCIATDQWILVTGSTTANPPGSWGTLNTPSPTNTPDGRAGSSTWMDSSGNFYLFGGTGTAPEQTYNDLWRFTPDALCGPCGSVAVDELVPSCVACYWNGEAIVLPRELNAMHASVFDASGRLVLDRDLSYGVDRLPLDLTSGAYWIRIRSAGTERAFSFFIPTKDR